MAEVIELRSEDTIPELESMLNALFDKEDMQQIVNSRKQLEYKLHKSNRLKEDCFNYINFELRLMKVIRMKHHKRGMTNKTRLNTLELNIGKRLNRVFISSIRWFPDDTKLWIAYLRFCKQMKFFVSGSRVLEQMLQLHGSLDHDMYLLAADWEMHQGENIDQARKYLVMGLHHHVNNRDLLKEAFKLELIDTYRKRKELLDNNMPIDPNNLHLTSKKAEIIYERSIKNLKDVELLNELMNLCAEYDFAADLFTKINSNLFEFNNDEKMWNVVATRTLANPDEKMTTKEKIKQCVGLYETAVKQLDNEVMWGYYLDTLIEMNRNTTVLQNYKRKLLISALQKASKDKKLTEKYYIIWVNYLQGPKKHDKLVEMLNGALKNLPHSVELWSTLLRVHMTKGEERLGYQAFEKATEILREKSLPLWKLMLQFEQIKRSSKVEDIFKKSLTMHSRELSDQLIPLFLEWLVLSQGIAACRKIYDDLCNIYPPFLEMHTKMIYLETIQPNVHLKRIRKCYTIACIQYGDNNVDVWIDYCRFESTIGNPELVSDVYWRALTHLAAPLAEILHAELSMIHQALPAPPLNT